MMCFAEGLGKMQFVRMSLRKMQHLSCQGIFVFKIQNCVALLAGMITVTDVTAIFHQMLVSQFIRFLIY